MASPVLVHSEKEKTRLKVSLTAAVRGTCLLWKVELPEETGKEQTRF